jgi:glutamate dehydrogenase (NAD(P)+)
VAELLALQEKEGVVALPYFQDRLAGRRGGGIKFSNASDDLLRESAFCLVPAAPVANYLDVDAGSNPSMTVQRAGDWYLIVEGANTYSPDPSRKAARAKMERTVYWQKGVLIATDFLVNSGGVIYAAQEQLIKTPGHLRIPVEMLGHAEAVERWLAEHKADFQALAEKRRIAAKDQLNRVIRRNMKELVDRLVADPDMLPCEAAERIGVDRIATSESDRTVADVMESIATIGDGLTAREAAAKLVEEDGHMLAVVNEAGELVGVVTDWDITQASATGRASDCCITEIMTTEVISARPDETILDVVRKLEHYEYSAMPVVSDQGVIGVISSDILAHRTLYRLLQAQG